MLIPSIDLEEGSTVQLVGGKERALDAGDPRPLAERFGRVGEIAVIDLDAARNRSDNAALVEELLPLARCRVGGGIRDAKTALAWLDRGAARVLIGTAAREELLRELPAERVVVALDAVDGEVVVDGWQTRTGADVFDRLRELRELAGGFLVTFVEREGRMEGIDLDLARRLREAAGDADLTVAGGVRDVEEIAALDALGIDVQVGMALYTGRIELADAFLAPLLARDAEGPWPTVVCDEDERALGLVYSSRESVRAALESGEGIYHSRRRGLWPKGRTSGDTQTLLGVELDCDRDALRFRVRQHGRGFCHRGTRSCWGEDGGVAALDRRLRARLDQAPEGSYTRRLLDDPALLRSKLLEEAGELVEAGTPDEVLHEAADVLYFTLVHLARAGLEWSDLQAEMDRRALRVSRRRGDAKTSRSAAAARDRVAAASCLPRRTPAEVGAQGASPLPEEVREGARAIVASIAAGGEAALRDHRTRLDGIDRDQPLFWEAEDLALAFEQCDEETRELLRRTAARIERFARAQRETLTDLDLEEDAARMGHRVLPVERAGCYAPGGRFPLPSSVLMTVIPARVAGVGEVVVASPSDHPLLRAAAHVAGADRLLRAGGAHAIATLAHGVESSPACDVVVGPGNAWVAAAKEVVAGVVRIDSVAGPSELVVVANASVDAELVAADLLAQAEHDPDARPGLVALDERTLDAVDAALGRQLDTLATAEVARRALSGGFATLVDGPDEAAELCNLLAPEHLQWMIGDDPEGLRHYGALFLGSAAGEVLGDYGAGPNHVLPTGASARSRGGLSVFDFLKVPTWLAGEAPARVAADAEALARLEGLDAHARAAARRHEWSLNPKSGRERNLR